MERYVRRKVGKLKETNGSSMVDFPSAHQLFPLSFKKKMNGKAVLKEIQPLWTSLSFHRFWAALQLCWVIFKPLIARRVSFENKRAAQRL
jgi:hypothetical protein